LNGAEESDSTDPKDGAGIGEGAAGADAAGRGSVAGSVDTIGTEGIVGGANVAVAGGAVAGVKVAGAAGGLEGLPITRVNSPGPEGKPGAATGALGLGSMLSVNGPGDGVETEPGWPPPNIRVKSPGACCEGDPVGKGWFGIPGVGARGFRNNLENSPGWLSAAIGVGIAAGVGGACSGSVGRLRPAGSKSFVNSPGFGRSSAGLGSTTLGGAGADG
jgi:hypothetical protein